MPKVRIVADYGARGYVLVDEAARRYGVLPVDEDLLAAIDAWAASYDAGCDPLAYEDLSGKRFDFIAFAAEGLALACAVKRALPGWTVTYFDEALDWYYGRDPRHYAPARAEYEVTLREALAAAPPARVPPAAGGR